MRLQQVGLAFLAIMAGGVLVPFGRAQVKAPSDASVAIEGTAPASDPRYGYVRLALRRIQQKHPDLQIPPNIARIVVDNKQLAEALGFPVEQAKEMDKGFMYTLTEGGRFARPTFVNVKSRIWEVLMTNQRLDDQVEPVICVLAASLEHEIVGHMIRNYHSELAPTELEISALRECAQGGMANHPSVTGRLAWLDRRLQTLKNVAPEVVAAKK